MHALQQMLWAGVTGCCFLLLRELYRSQSFWLTPFFATYILAICIYYPIWNPNNAALYAIAEPILMALKAGAVLEMFLLATKRISPTERRSLLFLLVAVATLGVLFAIGSMPGDARRAIRQYAHVWLGLASAFGCLAMWIHPSVIWPRIRNHGLILSGYMVNYAVVGFLPRTTMKQWLTANCWFFAVSIVCLLLWLYRGLLVTQPVDLELKTSHTVL